MRNFKVILSCDHYFWTSLPGWHFAFQVRSLNEWYAFCPHSIHLSQAELLSGLSEVKEDSAYDKWQSTPCLYFAECCVSFKCLPTVYSLPCLTIFECLYSTLFFFLIVCFLISYADLESLSETVLMSQILHQRSNANWRVKISALSLQLNSQEMFIDSGCPGRVPIY